MAIRRIAWAQWDRETAEKRDRANRWHAKARSMVIHPVYGSAVVPHVSNFGAICCAAELWDIPWAWVIDAQVVVAPEGALLGIVKDPLVAG